MNLVKELPDQRPVDEEAMSAVTYASRQVTARNNVLFQKTNYSVSDVIKRSITATIFAKDKWTKRRKTRKVQSKTVPIPRIKRLSRPEKLQQRETQLHVELKKTT